MAMVLSGARGETQADMLKALRHSLAANEIDPANAKALAALLAYNEAGAKCPDGFKLNGKLCEAAAPEEQGRRIVRAAPTRKDDLCVIDNEAAAAKLRIANALMLVNAQATVAPAYRGDDPEELQRRDFPRRQSRRGQ